MQIQIQISLQFLRRVNEKKSYLILFATSDLKEQSIRICEPIWMLNHLNELEI